MKTATKMVPAWVVGWVITSLTLPATASPETFVLDPAHSSIVFRIKHNQVSYVYGRFNSPEGQFTLDTDNPANSSVAIQIATENVDTGNRGRDNHLRSPDFFNAQQFRTISVKSTSVKKTGDKQYEVTALLNLHGVEKEITVPMEETGRAESRGRTKIGFEGKFTIKRSDFGMTNMMGGVGDEVNLIVAVEATKQ